MAEHVAIYARAARPPRHGEAGIEQQVQTCHAMATARGMIVQAIYRDAGPTEARRGAIYARVACVPQTGESKIEQQVAACLTVAAAHGVAAKAIYRDQGPSERSGLGAILRAVSAGHLDVVIVDDLNRFSRAEPERSRILQELMVAGVAVIVGHGRVRPDETETVWMAPREEGQH